MGIIIVGEWDSPWAWLEAWAWKWVFATSTLKPFGKKKVSFIAIRQGQKLGLLEIAKGCATQSKRFFSFLILIKYIMWMFCKNLLSFYCLTIAITKSYPNKLGRLYGHDTIWQKKKIQILRNII